MDTDHIHGCTHMPMYVYKNTQTDYVKCVIGKVHHFRKSSFAYFFKELGQDQNPCQCLLKKLCCSRSVSVINLEVYF